MSQLPGAISHGDNTGMLTFEWDERKRRTNLRDHRVDFIDVAQAWLTFCPWRLDDREDYGEDRWVAAGWVGDSVVLAVYTEPDPYTVRLISARYAKPHERETLHREGVI